MGEKLTDEQFVRALNLSTICTNKNWKFTTEMQIASAIAKAKNKELIISQIEKIITTNSEQDFLNKLNSL